MKYKKCKTFSQSSQGRQFYRNFGISSCLQINSQRSSSISGCRGIMDFLPLLWFMYLSCFPPCLTKPQLCSFRYLMNLFRFISSGKYQFFLLQHIAVRVVLLPDIFEVHLQGIHNIFLYFFNIYALCKDSRYLLKLTYQKAIFPFFNHEG